MAPCKEQQHWMKSDVAARNAFVAAHSTHIFVAEAADATLHHMVAPVHRVAAHPHRVVPPALPIPHIDSGNGLMQHSPLGVRAQGRILKKQ
jgi:hypothetical protein